MSIHCRSHWGLPAGVALLGVLGSLGAAGYQPAAPNRYAGGEWLPGDGHIHTMYSSDGSYPIEEQVEQAVRHGLRWCVITDHGGIHHDKVALEQAYPALLRARKRFPQIVIYQGLEWTIPAAEHGGVILPIHDHEAETIADFERHFDRANESSGAPNPDTEAHALAGLRHLEQLAEKPLFFAHHPARRGLDSPHELRAWSDAAPTVARGMEAAPGHQAATIHGGYRGAYHQQPPPTAFPGLPPEAYLTYGGFDWYTASVGGMWDSLLSEGRAWYVTANSDSHKQYQDRRRFDQSQYRTLGHARATGEEGPPDGGEFWPGEYSRTVVYAARAAPDVILAAMRAGRMFAVHGDLIDRLELTARTPQGSARMGETLAVRPETRSLGVTIRLHVPDRLNAAGQRPRPHHVDLIAGELGQPSTGPDRMTDASTRVLRRFEAADWKETPGGWLEMATTIPLPRAGLYVRLRGTNRSVTTPAADPLGIDPWSDLWFYSNPVFARLPQPRKGAKDSPR